MQIIVARPPNFEAILKVFPQAAGKGVMFAWDDVIFSPDSAYVPPQLQAHEEVHSTQQRAVGGPQKWWNQYLVDADFRYAQELAAHIVEYYDFIRHTKSRAMRHNYLDQVAKRLSGPLYNNAVSYQEAVQSILQGR